jgi:periplasmic protein CpxP/Spy
MIIPKIGLILLLAATAAMAQQQPIVPSIRQAQPFMDAYPPPSFTEAERMRFREIISRRDRGEAISPEDQRFAQDIMRRMNQMQRGAAPQPNQPGAGMRPNQAPGPAAAATQARPAQPPLERALGVPGGKWWTRPEMAQRLGLAADQVKKMDETFQQFRLKLIDLRASVQKEDAIMDPLIGAEQPDESKIVAQIDKIAQARAELEKTNARMLLGIRRILTQEQWRKLKAEPPARLQPVGR